MFPGRTFCEALSGQTSPGREAQINQIDTHYERAFAFVTHID